MFVSRMLSQVVRRGLPSWTLQLGGGGRVCLMHILSRCAGASATTAPRVNACANSLPLLPLQSGSESELQTQLDWLSESNQVAVVVSQQGLPKLGFFSEDENAWGHAEVAMWGDMRVQFVTCENAVVLPADCYKSMYTGLEECIKLAVSVCKTTAELRECFNHTTAEQPACCLGRVGNEWVDKYKKPTHDPPRLHLTPLTRQTAFPHIQSYSPPPAHTPPTATPDRLGAGIRFLPWILLVTCARRWRRMRSGS